MKIRIDKEVARQLAYDEFMSMQADIDYDPEDREHFSPDDAEDQFVEIFKMCYETVTVDVIKKATNNKHFNDFLGLLDTHKEQVFQAYGQKCAKYYNSFVKDAIKISQWDMVGMTDFVYLNRAGERAVVKLDGLFFVVEEPNDKSDDEIIRQAIGEYYEFTSSLEPEQAQQKASEAVKIVRNTA